MAKNFCSLCIASWYKNTIMDCQLCSDHLASQWTFSDLIRVYGKKLDLLEALKVPTDGIVPPLQSRRVLPTVNLKRQPTECYEDNIKAYKVNFNILRKDQKLRLQHVRDDLIAFHATSQREQRLAFLQQEMFLVKQFLEAGTEEAKIFLFSGLDPLTQAILNS